MAKKKINEEGVASESAPVSHEAVAREYLDGNPQYKHEEIIVTDDGVVFEGTLKGDNAAFNYCRDKGNGFKKLKTEEV